MSLPTSPVATDSAYGASHAGLTDILSSAVSHGASDIHIRAGIPPLVRVDGELWPLGVPALTPEDVLELVLGSMPDDETREVFRRDHECDFAVSIEGVGRFRANAYHARGAAALVMRHVRTDVPSVSDLGLPAVVTDLARKSNGLILVCGPTGSGKSTTLAAMIDIINTERRCHILAIEDPIEFMHADKQSTISQREVSTDTVSFGRALRSGMRQDPDVILIGEIRDAETMRIALQAAETGHLVLASLHAKTVIDAVNRVLDLFPADEQKQARLSLADSIQGVLCQNLVHNASGSGRVMVLEVGVATQRFREAVADPEKTVLLDEIVNEGEYYGMRSFEQDAVRLVMAGTITMAEADKVVVSPSDFRVALRRAGYRDPA